MHVVHFVKMAIGALRLMCKNVSGFVPPESVNLFQDEARLFEKKCFVRNGVEMTEAARFQYFTVVDTLADTRRTPGGHPADTRRTGTLPDW
jgi:hypothetical protein